MWKMRAERCPGFQDAGTRRGLGTVPVYKPAALMEEDLEMLSPWL